MRGRRRATTANTSMNSRTCRHRCVRAVDAADDDDDGRASVD
jgi:hypothetical protein